MKKAFIFACYVEESIKFFLTLKYMYSILKYTVFMHEKGIYICLLCGRKS